MAHPPEATLAKELELAGQLVIVGATYAHYKDTDKYYKVTGLAVLESTDEVAVLYKALYGKGFTFVRPLSSWVEDVEWEEATVPRFKRVAL